MAEAVHMYNLALEASPDMASTQARIRNLARVHLPENRMSAAKELKAIPTTKLPMILDKSASADFDVLIAPSGRVESAAFVGGSELLRKAAIVRRAELRTVPERNGTTRQDLRNS